MADAPNDFLEQLRQYDAARGTPVPGGVPQTTQPQQQIPGADPRPDWLKNYDDARGVTYVPPPYKAPDAAGNVNAWNILRSVARGIPLGGGGLDEAYAAGDTLIDAMRGKSQLGGENLHDKYLNALQMQRG